MRRAAWAVVLWTLIAASTALAKDPPLLALQVEHFRDTATVQDDVALGTSTISTEKGFVERHGPLRTVWNDEYLRAVINHATGQRSFDVAVSFTYSGNRRSYSTASYQAAGSAQTVPVAVNRPDTLNCATGECTYTEHVRFPVDEPVLRGLATDALAGHPHLWTFKVIGPAGGDYAGTLSTAEIAGLLAKTDEIAPSGAPRAVSAAPRDLGVGVLRIDATEESPPRSGLLLTAVNRGSVAQKSGLLVGDILCEVDGHAVHSLSELESTLAASRLRAAVTLKFYRGTGMLNATAQF
jgi:PDZ domain